VCTASSQKSRNTLGSRSKTTTPSRATR
jgi:hypothetical protein